MEAAVYCETMPPAIRRRKRRSYCEGGVVGENEFPDPNCSQLRAISRFRNTNELSEHEKHTEEDEGGKIETGFVFRLAAYLDLFLLWGFGSRSLSFLYTLLSSSHSRRIRVRNKNSVPCLRS